ncbi:hypothetical protein [Vibrio litoralis]|uniref:hypothetical protein n=1 Tax=Vibrio litoralis TaxID=335972 RepID=UPI00040EF5CD|nr:hypothetical protein [Vibrio litoralis]
MREFYKTTQVINVSFFNANGIWEGNGEESVAAGTKLPPYCTDILYTPSNEGKWGVFNSENGKWSEINDMRGTPFWDIQGNSYVIQVVNGDIPDWGVTIAPPKCEANEALRFDGNAWHVLTNIFWNEHGYEFPIGDAIELPEWAITTQPPIYDSKNQTILFKDNKWLTYDILIGTPYYMENGEKVYVTDINFELPQNCSWNPKPEIVKGFDFVLIDGDWVQKEDHRDKPIWEKATGTRFIMGVLGEIPDEYTLEQPQTQCDEWINGKWITNDQKYYELQIQEVESTRRALYTNVDALRNEAAMIRLTEGDEAKALDYEQQAKDLYLKIRDENPWPISPSE